MSTLESDLEMCSILDSMIAEVELFLLQNPLNTKPLANIWQSPANHQIISRYQSIFKEIAPSILPAILNLLFLKHFPNTTTEALELNRRLIGSDKITRLIAVQTRSMNIAAFQQSLASILLSNTRIKLLRAVLKVFTPMAEFIHLSLTTKNIRHLEAGNVELPQDNRTLRGLTFTDPIYDLMRSTLHIAETYHSPKPFEFRFRPSTSNFKARHVVGFEIVAMLAKVTTLIALAFLYEEAVIKVMLETILSPSSIAATADFLVGDSLPFDDYDPIDDVDRLSVSNRFALSCAYVASVAMTEDESKPTEGLGIVNELFQPRKLLAELTQQTRIKFEKDAAAVKNAKFGTAKKRVRG